MTCDQPTGAVGASRQPHGSEVVSASPRMVRAEGLEPPQLSSLEPKSSASTSSATPADSIMSGRDAAGAGLITWAHPSAAKKWPPQNLRGSTRGGWTYPAENGRHLPYGRANFPTGPAWLYGRNGCRGPRSGDAGVRCRPRPSIADAASQSWRHRLASGTTEYTDMVADSADARPRFALQA